MLRFFFHFYPKKLCELRWFVVQNNNNVESTFSDKFCHCFPVDRIYFFFFDFFIPDWEENYCLLERKIRNVFSSHYRDNELLWGGGGYDKYSRKSFSSSEFFKRHKLSSVNTNSNAILQVLLWKQNDLIITKEVS